MSKLTKIGSDIWFDLEPGEALNLRHGTALTWFGPRETLTSSSVKSFGTNLKNSLFGLPLFENEISVTDPTKLLAQAGTINEIWELELDDTPVFFKGGCYLGRRGDVTLNLRKLNFNDFLYMVEPTGTGKIYLSFPTNILGLPLKGRTICTSKYTIALIKGEPEFKNYTVKKEFKDLFKKGGWTRTNSSEISQAEEIYIYGGSANSLLSTNSED